MTEHSVDTEYTFNLPGSPTCDTQWASVFRLPETVHGDGVHSAIIGWLRANDIDPGTTPATARFIVTQSIIQIEQFDMQVTGFDRPIRTVSLLGNGFVKTERTFPLKAPLAGFTPVPEMVAVA